MSSSYRHPFFRQVHQQLEALEGVEWTPRGCASWRLPRKTVTIVGDTPLPLAVGETYKERLVLEPGHPNGLFLRQGRSTLGLPRDQGGGGGSSTSQSSPATKRKKKSKKNIVVMSGGGGAASPQNILDTTSSLLQTRGSARSGGTDGSIAASSMLQQLQPLSGRATPRSVASPNVTSLEGARFSSSPRPPSHPQQQQQQHRTTAAAAMVSSDSSGAGGVVDENNNTGASGRAKFVSSAPVPLLRELTRLRLLEDDDTPQQQQGNKNLQDVASINSYGGGFVGDAVASQLPLPAMLSSPLQRSGSQTSRGNGSFFQQGGGGRSGSGSSGHAPSGSMTQRLMPTTRPRWPGGGGGVAAAGDNNSVASSTGRGGGGQLSSLDPNRNGGGGGTPAAPMAGNSSDGALSPLSAQQQQQQQQQLALGAAPVPPVVPLPPNRVAMLRRNRSVDKFAWQSQRSTTAASVYSRSFSLQNQAKPPTPPPDVGDKPTFLLDQPGSDNMWYLEMRATVRYLETLRKHNTKEKSLTGVLSLEEELAIITKSVQRSRSGT